MRRDIYRVCRHGLPLPDGVSDRRAPPASNRAARPIILAIRKNLSSYINTFILLPARRICWSGWKWSRLPFTGSLPILGSMMDAPKGDMVFYLCSSDAEPLQTDGPYSKALVGTYNREIP